MVHINKLILGETAKHVKWVVEDLTERSALTLTADDNYKICAVIDALYPTYELYLLLDYSVPTWLRLGMYDDIAGNPTVEIINQALTTQTTTSASYVDHDASNSILTFTKVSDTSDLLVNLNFPLYSTAVNTIAAIGIHDGTSTTQIMAVPLSVANAWISPSGVVKIAGVGAGSVSLKIQWKRTSGTGTLSTSTGIYWSMSVQEVQP